MNIIYCLLGFAKELVVQLLGEFGNFYHCIAKVISFPISLDENHDGKEIVPDENVVETTVDDATAAIFTWRVLQSCTILVPCEHPVQFWCYL